MASYPFRFLFTCLLIIASSIFAFLQAQPVFTMDGSDINSCNGFFTDSGGANGAYGNGETFTTTICPDGSTGSHVQLWFYDTDIAPGDLLCFYDGPDAAAPLLNCYLFSTNQFIIQATADNPSGCITVTFNSNASGTAGGWFAEINCVPACQLVEAAINVLAPDTFSFVDTLANTISVCMGEPIQLEARGLYPQNGLAYNQADSTSTFQWLFADGSTYDTTSVTHIFTDPGTYEIQLLVTDTLGCRNLNFFNASIEVAPPPLLIHHQSSIPTICLGDTTDLTFSSGVLNPLVDISLLPDTVPVFPLAQRTDSLPLPDGDGASFETPLILTEFGPGATLEDVNQLESICVNMEHSWVYDLEIAIECPNGTTVNLFENPGGAGTETFLGAPFELDEGTTPIPGLGFEYCWSPNAPNPTWLDYILLNDPDTLPAGTYTSDDPLSDLVGCPLNGEWTIIISDLLINDNGFVFSWGLSFIDSLYPQQDSLVVPLTNVSWQPVSPVVNNTSPTLLTTPDQPGLFQYPLILEDAFGCVYDTLLGIRVLPETDTACYNCPTPNPLPDVTVCEGDSTPLNASILLPGPDTLTTFEKVEAQTSIPDSTFLSTLPVNAAMPDQITEATEQICGVCIQLNATQSGSIQLQLTAPSGETLLLSAFNGNGAGFQNTCFTPDALDTITNGTAPFTGDWQPQGDWSALNGATINGDWQLQVTDTAQGVEIIGWSICLDNTYGATYQWSPGTGLSCTNCPTPLFTGTDTTQFVVEITDVFGCSARDTFEVAVIETITLDTPICNTVIGGLLSLTWPATPGVDDFFINPQTQWINLGTSNNYQLAGLQDGDTVNFQFTATPITGPCPIDTIDFSCVYLSPCTLQGSLDNVTDPSCFNTQDGSIQVSASGAIGEVLYSLPGQGPQASGFFGNLGPGTYPVAVEDTLGCQDTIMATVTPPDTLLLSIQGTDLLCNQDSTGVLSPNTTAAQGNSIYNWVGPAGFASSDSALNQLSAGIYCLTVTDDNGCSVTACDTLLEPDALQFSFSGTGPSCATDMDGNLTVNPAGGTTPYTYNWDPLFPNQPNLNMLGAGTYSLTLTDANGCSVAADTVLSAPLPLSIDSIEIRPPSCAGDGDGTAVVQEISGGIPPYAYLWSGGNNPQDSLNTGLSAGDYLLGVTDANGCQTVQPITVEDPDTLILALEADSVLCFGDSTGNVRSTVLGGSPPYNYSWNGGPTTPDWNGVSAGQYLLQLEDNNGCIRMDSIEVGQPPALAINLQQIDTACAGEPDGSAQAVASGGSPGYLFNWSSGSNQPQAENLAAQLYTLTVTDTNGCSLQDSLSIQEYIPITAMTAAMAPDCADGNNGTAWVTGITGGVGAPYALAWNTSPIQQTDTAMNLAGGFTYTVEVTDSVGCSAGFSIAIPNPDSVIATTLVTPVSCFGESDGGIEVQAGGGDGNYQYSWSNNAQDRVINDLAAGFYTVTVTDGLGCSVVVTEEVSEPPALSVESSSINPSCGGDSDGSIALTPTGGTPGYSVSWSGGQTGLTLTDLEVGTYSYTLTDANGCELLDSVILQAPPAVEVDVEVSEISCFGESDGGISLFPVSGSNPFTFSLNGGGFSSQSEYMGLSAGTYQLSAQDANGCSWSQAVTIASPPPLMVDAGPDITISLGDSAQLSYSVQNASGAVSQIWQAQFGGTFWCQGCQLCPAVEVDCLAPLVFPTYNIFYQVTVTDENGCTATDDVQVLVPKERDIYVPTGFTPNNDGFNDELGVLGQPDAEVLVFRIFDRWGEMVFEARDFEVNDPVQAWDGRFLNEPVPAGTYVWYVEAQFSDGARTVVQGQTELIR